MITYDEVRRIFHYDPDTGVWMRLTGGRGVKTKLNTPIGCPGTKGSLRVGYKGKYYFVHRLAWLYMTGSWPSNQIDHRNRNASDNRWENLREATHAENIWNQRPKTTKRQRGVWFCKKTGRYATQIIHSGRTIWLGRFDTKEQAIAAYEATSLRLRGEFHPQNSQDTSEGPS